MNATRWRRILQFPGTRLLLALLFVIVGITLGQGVLRLNQATWEEAPLVRTGLNLVGGALVIGAYLLYVRLVEQRRTTEFALSPGLRELLMGIGVGALLFTVTIGLIWLLGAYTVTGTNPPSLVLRAFVVSLIAAFTEEVIFRAVIYRIFEEALGTWLALVISALFFGFAHFFNPGATLFSSIAIALEAGLLLAAMYTWTQRLWLSVGTHFGWNFTQGAIFGVALSGNEMPGLLVGKLSGPAWLTGGSFGAEASVIALLVCLLAFGYYLVRIRREHKITPPRWQQRA